LVHRDLAYVPGGHERQKLDLYLPKAGTGFPLICIAAGSVSGYFFNKKNKVQPNKG